MAYFALIWKARTIEKYRLSYEKEKLNSIRIMNSGNPQKKTRTLYQRLCRCNCNTKKRISKTFLRYYPEGSNMYNLCYYLKTDQTFPNFVMKSVIGFTGGIVLTYLCFMFFVFQLAISLIHATIMSSIIGVLLTLGLAFSYRIRCLVFLLIPQFFSRVGRYTLTCYALVLILTGPATNTLKNSEVLSESLACAQEQVKTDMYLINESVKKPYNSMKDSIGLMIGGIKQLAAKIKKATLHLHRLTLSLAHSIQSSFLWLNSVADSCNKNLGSPYHRCCQAIQHSIIECQAALGPWYSWLCDVGKLTKVACWPVKPLPNFCHVFDFPNGDILGVVTKKLNTFSERINSMLHLEVHVHHSYSLSNNASRSASQVAAGIVTEIRNRADLMLTWLSWSSCVTSASLLLIIFRAKYYQNMYETRSRFDNRYVTKELIDLDLKRLRQGKETVLPLNRREEGKYIKTSSFRLVSSERVHLSRSAVTMAITTFKLLIHMVADYSLYWVLMTIRHHGLCQTPLKPGNPNAGPYVSGSTLISKILLSLVGSMTAPLETPPPSTITCLPNPYPPNFHRYLQIGLLIFLLWFFALFEPYGLRLRHIIMGLYRSERAKARAVWLFNHIQRTRGSFLKFARRKLHREYKYSSEQKYTLRRWLHAHIPCVCLKIFLGIFPDEPHCFLCGIIEDCNECDGSLVWCDTPDCPGTYCTKCFSDIGQLCTVCLSPADYGDMSDVSLEKGSSEESDDEDPGPPPDSTSKPEDDNEGSSKRKTSKKRRWSFFSRKKKKKGIDEIPLLEHKNEKFEPTEERKLNLLLLCACKASVPEDENEASSKKQLTEKRRRLLFSRNKKKEGKEEMPLLEYNYGNYESIQINERKLNKATIVRHKKYTDLDLQNERHKAIISLGFDTNCSIFHDHCEVCAINKPAKIENPKLQKAMHKSKNEKTDFTLKTNSKNQSNNNFNGKDLEVNLKPSKHNSSIDESIAKVKQHFKNMRKYTLNIRHSQTVIRTRSNRTLLIKIPDSLKSRRGSRKRKKRLKTLSKTSMSKPTFIPNISVSSQKVFSPKRKTRHGFKNKRADYGFGHKIMNLVYNARHISSTVAQLGQSSRTTSDIHLQLQENYILNNVTNFATDCSNFIVAGPSKAKSQTDAPQKEESPNIKEDDREFNTTKYIKNKKSSHGKRKLYNICTNYWKNGALFSPSVKLVNYFRNDNVPMLYGTTNHKKRKKNDSLEQITNAYQSKKENEATRKYRISTYLSEQDWMKKRCKDSKPEIRLETEIHNVDVKNEVLNDLLQAENEVTKDTFKKAISKHKYDAISGTGDNNKKNRNHSPEVFITKDKAISSEAHPKEPKIRSQKLHDKRPKKNSPERNERKVKNQNIESRRNKTKIKSSETNQKDFKINAEESFEKCNKVKKPKSKTNDANDKITVLTPAKDPNSKLSVNASSEYKASSVKDAAAQLHEFGGISMNRSMGYYRSLGNRDFDPYMDINEHSPVESLLAQKEEKEANEKETEVRVSVEDAKAQTIDLATYNQCAEKKSVFKIVTAVEAPENSTRKDFRKTWHKLSSCKKGKVKPKNIDHVEKVKAEKCSRFNPFSIIVRWCHVHLERRRQRAETSNQDNQSKIDAVVGVFPHVQNNYCQYGETVPIHDQTTQVYVLKEVAQSMSQHSDMFRDVGIHAVTGMRNGATQYTYSCRHAATYYQGKRSKHKRVCQDASTIHFNALKCEVDRDTMTAQKTTQHSGVQCHFATSEMDTIKHNQQDCGKSDIRRFEALQKKKLKNNQEVKDKPQENKQKSKEQEENQGHKVPGPYPETSTKKQKQANPKTKGNENVKDIQIADPYPETSTKKQKQANPKTKGNENVKDIQIAGPSRPETKQKNQPDKTRTDTCPHCGACSSAETSSSLGIFQSLPSMEINNLKNYDLMTDTEDSKTSEEFKISVEESKTETDDAMTNKVGKSYLKMDGEDNKKNNDDGTTVYTMSTFDYEPPRRKKNRKLKVSVITKSNMATCTEPTKLRNASTVTSDWWSPILERKNKSHTISKKGVQEKQAIKKKPLKDTSVGTEGRFVTFNSRAEIIPSMHTHLNLMSPSRYLLESQRYYNELFSNKYYPMSSNTFERIGSDKRYSLTRRHAIKKRQYKSKRTEESSAPRSVINPFMEQIWTAEAIHQRLPSSSVQHRKPRVSVIKNNTVSATKGLQTKGVKKSKHPQRNIRKPELKIKKGEVNLLTRRYLSNDNISLDSHCNSITETGSF